jgi:hypothetical protein
VKRRTTLTSQKLWQNHETRILRVVSLALQMLRREGVPLSYNEDQINRRLYFLIQRANRKLLATEQHLDWPLYYEARNQPNADDPVRAIRERKRPDFKWGICDHSEPDPDRSFKQYDIECKRLGAPTKKSPGWYFNRNYIVNGVVRFTMVKWSYGQATSSGAMIGYIQSMGMNQILKEVNASAKSISIPDIKLDKAGWKSKGISRLDHRLDRPAVPLTPFDLRHLWIDLR